MEYRMVPKKLWPKVWLSSFWKKCFLLAVFWDVEKDDKPMIHVKMTIQIVTNIQLIVAMVNFYWSVKKPAANAMDHPTLVSLVWTFEMWIHFILNAIRLYGWNIMPKNYGLNFVVDDMREGPLQFSVPECQGFKSCFSSPPSCWLEDPQCIFVSWKRDPATGSIFTFEGMRVNRI